MPRLRSSPRAPISRLAFAGLLLLLLGLVFATFPDYGMTTDEGVQQRYGNRLVRFYATLGADDSALWQNNLYYYGGLFELLAQGARRLSPWGMYETRHLVNALFGILGVLAAWGLGSRLAGATGGLLSALFLALTPRFLRRLVRQPEGPSLRQPLRARGLGDPGSGRHASASRRAPGDRDRRRDWRRCGRAGARDRPHRLAALLWLGSLALAQGAASADRKITGRAWARTGMAVFATSALAWVVMIATWPWAWSSRFATRCSLPEVLELLGRRDHPLRRPPWLGRDLPVITCSGCWTLTLPELYPLAFCSAPWVWCYCCGSGGSLRRGCLRSPAGVARGWPARVDDRAPTRRSTTAYATCSSCCRCWPFSRASRSRPSCAPGLAGSRSRPPRSPSARALS